MVHIFTLFNNPRRAFTSVARGNNFPRRCHMMTVLALFLTACGGTNASTPTPLPTPAIAKAGAPVPTSAPVEPSDNRVAETVAASAVDAAPENVTASAAITMTGDATGTPSPTPDPTIQPVEITMGDGTVLRASYYTVDDSATLVPGVLLMHSAYGSRGHWHDVAKQLQQAGVVVLAFDARGHGQSDGTRSFDQTMVEDGDRALGWLLSLPEIDRDRVGIAGSNFGSIVALRVALLYPEVGALVMLSPGRRMWRLSSDEVINEYGTRPILLAAAEEDTYHAGSAQWLAENALGESTTYIYSGKAHGTDLLIEHKALIDLLLDFFQTMLSQP